MDFRYCLVTLLHLMQAEQRRAQQAGGAWYYEEYSRELDALDEQLYKTWRMLQAIEEIEDEEDEEDEDEDEDEDEEIEEEEALREIMEGIAQEQAQTGEVA